MRLRTDSDAVVAQANGACRIIKPSSLRKRGLLVCLSPRPAISFGLASAAAQFLWRAPNDSHEAAQHMIGIAKSETPGNPLESLMQYEAPALGLFDRKGALTLDGFRNSGADFMPQFKPFIEDGKTIVASPHKLYGPQSNDLMLQLHKQRIDKIVLAGMASNLCVESHLREFLERGFEVVVVCDAVAGPKLPDGDGYGSALVDFRYIANDLVTTDEVVDKLEGR